MYKHGAKKTRQSSIVNYWKKVIQVFDSNLEIDEWAAPKRKLSQRSNETEIANDFELQMILMSFKHAPRSTDVTDQINLSISHLRYIVNSPRNVR